MHAWSREGVEKTKRALEVRGAHNTHPFVVKRNNGEVLVRRSLASSVLLKHGGSRSQRLPVKM